MVDLSKHFDGSFGNEETYYVIGVTFNDGNVTSCREWLLRNGFSSEDGKRYERIEPYGCGDVVMIAIKTIVTLDGESCSVKSHIVFTDEAVEIVGNDVARCLSMQSELSGSSNVEEIVTSCKDMLVSALRTCARNLSGGAFLISMII